MIRKLLLVSISGMLWFIGGGLAATGKFPWTALSLVFCLFGGLINGALAARADDRR